MSHKGALTFISIAGLLFATAAQAQSAEGTYRGMLVCEKLKTAANILRAPLDLVVQGKAIVFARPIFNGEGTRVVGSELAFGSIEADGKVHVTASWANGNAGFNGEYSGTLTPSGGTFMGTETWHVRGMSETRTCAAAMVPVPGGHGSPK
jgi:hypothetical protein